MTSPERNDRKSDGISNRRLDANGRRPADGPNDRRSGRPTRRASPRRLMPFGGVAPSGRLCRPGSACAHASLVDLSEGGVSAMVDGNLPLELGDALELTLHENFGIGSIKIAVVLCWMQPTPMGVRLGLRFSDPAFRPADTFLKCYLETDFGNDRRTSR